MRIILIMYYSTVDESVCNCSGSESSDILHKYSLAPDDAVHVLSPHIPAGGGETLDRMQELIVFRKRLGSLIR